MEIPRASSSGTEDNAEAMGLFGTVGRRDAMLISRP